jgi:putative transposase
VIASKLAQQQSFLTKLPTNRSTLVSLLPVALSRLKEDMEDALICISIPMKHRNRIQTINGVERLNQEEKRRTRAVRDVLDRASLLRLLTALVIDQSDKWESGRHCLDMAKE